MVRFPEDQQSWQHNLPWTQVRHECAEALGDIPGVEIEAEMAKYLDPKVDPVVRESCVVCIVMLNVIHSLTNLHLFFLRLPWIWRTTTTARSSSMQMAWALLTSRHKMSWLSFFALINALLLNFFLKECSQFCRASFRQGLVMAGLSISRAAGLVVYRILAEVYRECRNSGGQNKGGLKVAFTVYKYDLHSGRVETHSSFFCKQVTWRFGSPNTVL